MYLTFCLGLVFLSGLTALVYQVTWQKYLSHFLGGDALATTLVLSTFFVWLSVGYFAIGRSSHRLVRNKLLLYGLLEGGIGVWCLLSPWIFRGLWALFLPLLGGQAPELLSALAFTSLFIAVPTFLMGGTIPVLTDALSTGFQESHRTHALIYGINTAGAFVGTLLGGFVLVERLGLPGTLHATAVANVALLVITWIVSRVSTRSERIVEPLSEERAEPTGAGIQGLLLAQAFLSGFYVFSLENVLIRMAGISLGASTYTYSIIVASFILAIAAGSLSVALFRRIAGLRFFLVVQSLLCLAVVLLYLSVPEWPAWILRTRSLVHPALLNHGAYWTAVLGFFLALLLVPVGLMGMNLPLLFNYLRSRRQYLSQTVGRVYAVNAVGSALGAVVGGYWLFHHLEGDQVFKVSAIAVALTLPLLIWLGAAASQRSGVVGLSTLILVPAIWWLPEWPEIRFVPGLFNYGLPPTARSDFASYLRELRGEVEPEEILFTRHDPNGLFHVLQFPERRVLYVNGKPDADTAQDYATRALNALIPLSLAERPRRVFIVGLGAGLSTSIAAGIDEVEQVRVAEIAEGVIESLPYFREWNPQLEANRHKVEIVHGDAYRLLLVDRTRYDLILAEPSSLWVAGVEKLFTEEFYRQARSRLTAGGIFGQWINPTNLDTKTLELLLRTFQRVFPSATLWASAGAFVLVGGPEPIEVDFEQMARRFEAQRALHADLGLDHPLAILALQILPPTSLARIVAGEGPIQSLEEPQLGYRAGRAMFAQLTANLGELAPEALRRPLEAGDPGAAFVLDTYPGVLPPEFFAALDVHRRRYGLSTDTRLHILRARANAGPPPRWIPPPMLRQAAYLLGDPGAEAGNPRGLIDAYSLLKNAQFPLDIDRVTAPVLRACDDGDCDGLPYLLLRTHFSEEELRERGVPPIPDWSGAPEELRTRAAHIWSEIFDTPPPG